MMGLRKKVERRYRIDRVTIVEKAAQVAGEHGRIARDIRNDAWPKPDKVKYRFFLGPEPRRVEQREIDLARTLTREKLSDRLANVFDICQTRVVDILHRELDRRRVIFNRDDVFESSRKRQREKA